MDSHIISRKEINNFLTPFPPENNNCNVCNNLLSLSNSFLCQNCNFKICENCKINPCKQCSSTNFIKKDLKNSNFYSHVCYQYSSYKQVQILSSEICDFCSIKCEGCHHIFCFNEYKIHYRNCEFIEITCTNCNFKSIRRDFSHSCELNIELSNKIRQLEEKIQEKNNPIILIEKLEENFSIIPNIQIDKKDIEVNAIVKTNERQNKTEEGYEILIEYCETKFKISAVLYLEESDDIFLLGAEEGYISIFNKKEKDAKINFSEHVNKITCLKSLDSNAKLFLSSSLDRTIKLWDIDIKKSLRTFNNWCGVISIIVINNKEFVSGDMNGEIKIWKLNSKNNDFTKITSISKKHGNFVSSFIIIPYSQSYRLVSGGYDSIIHIWDVGNYKWINNYNEHRGFINHLSYYKDDLFISCSSDKTMKIWNLCNKKSLKTIKIHSKSILSCYNFNDLLVSYSLDNTLKVSNIETGAMLNILEVKDMTKFINTQHSSLKIIGIKEGLGIIFFKFH